MLGPREYADASERVHMIARPYGYSHVLMRLPGPIYGLSPEPITHAPHLVSSRLVYLHVPAECACLPAISTCLSAASCTTAHFIPHSDQPKTRLPLQSPYFTSTAVVVPSNSSTFARQLPIVTRHHHSARPTSS
jgi:hypothetical protein